MAKCDFVALKCDLAQLELYQVSVGGQDSLPTAKNNLNPSQRFCEHLDPHKMKVFGENSHHKVRPNFAKTWEDKSQMLWGSTRYLARTPCFVLCLIGVETEGLLDYQRRAGIMSIVRWNLRPFIFGVEGNVFSCPQAILAVSSVVCGEATCKPFLMERGATRRAFPVCILHAMMMPLPIGSVAVVGFCLAWVVCTLCWVWPVFFVQVGCRTEWAFLALFVRSWKSIWCRTW